MMNAEEQEYMDYLIHNRTQLTNQITRHLDELLVLEKKLEIAIKALKRIYQPVVGDIYNFETDELDHSKLQDIAQKALKEIDLVGTSVSLAKEEQ